ncbi:unnamed protein product [Cuscuta campestris]|uniref:PLAT domain-containing protein n=1 Tax=Cuscuta campestris TaxID=132261 RepID=A0A484M8B0_9ASTE|nr:unnamed protein product [Cuscuta campestris]
MFPSAKMTTKKIEGKVVLMRKNVLDLNDLSASIADDFSDFLGHKVSIHLISSTRTPASSPSDPTNGSKEELGTTGYLENWVLNKALLADGKSAFRVSFDWTEDFGVPGAFIIKNNHHNEFYLKTLTLEDVPNHGDVHFVCFSWVYPASKYHYDRVFFSNQFCPSLFSIGRRCPCRASPSKTPGPNRRSSVPVVVASLRPVAIVRLSCGRGSPDVGPVAVSASIAPIEFSDRRQSVAQRIKSKSPSLRRRSPSSSRQLSPDPLVSRQSSSKRIAQSTCNIVL